MARDRRSLLLLLAASAICPFGVASRPARAQTDVVGVDVVPHTFSAELRWRRPPDPRPGMLVRLFVRRTAAEGPRGGETVTIDGRRPGDLLAAGEWTWHDLPDGSARPGEGGDGSFGERLDVWTFNAVGEDWIPGRRIEVGIRPGAAESPGPATVVQVVLAPPAVALSRVLFRDDDADGCVDGVTAHVTNGSAVPVRVESIRVWTPGADGRAIHDLVPEPPVTDLRAAGDGSIAAGDRGVVEAGLGRLPRGRGVVEVVARDADGTATACRGHLRFKDDAFAIGAGWLDIRTEPGVVPLASDAFRRLLARMHVDTAHVGEIGGLTDRPDPDGLFPLRLGLMSGFEDVDRYSTAEWARRIHGVDALGEPQMDKTPARAFEVLERYALAPFPTTVTLSEEKGFRFYAGLSDHPHFDAYRVNAPAADAWGLYDRWGGERLRWGAPLEGIGAMTRTLRAMSRPAPIAAWSQNVHEGWGSVGGRTRRSPTPDEIRVQAYEALAGGATSLYWYSLQSWALLAFRDAIGETTRIGREIRLLEPIYRRSDAHAHERRDADGRPDWDLDTLVAPDAALLFAIDLAYEADPETKTFRFPGPRDLDASFPLPAFLRPPSDVFRVDAGGIHAVEHEIIPGGVRVRDRVDRVAVYVAATRAGVRLELAARHRGLLAAEEACGPDPAVDDAAFATLLRELGYRSLDEVGRGRR